MPNEPIDALQIKIEQAKAKLPEATINAINAVDWKAGIFSLREKKGYTFEQLGDLEIETELMLCGLVSSSEYPKELEKRMGISKAQVDELVNEMNSLVFSRIKAELIKNSERKRIFDNKSTPAITREVMESPVQSPYSTMPAADVATLHKDDMHTLDLHGIQILPKTNLNSPKTSPAPSASHPILSQKLGSSIQNPVKSTEHTLENISKGESVSAPVRNSKPAVDPYREMPE